MSEAKNNREKPQSKAVEKRARAEQAAAAERRKGRLYIACGVAILLLFAAAMAWRSGVFIRNKPGAEVDGVRYTVGEVAFFYYDVVREFMDEHQSDYAELGLDPDVSMREQIVGTQAAEALGIGSGREWYYFFMNRSLKRLSAVQRALLEAEAEGYVFSDSVQEQYEAVAAELSASAAGAGKSVKEYLRDTMGGVVTKSVYLKQTLRCCQYNDYVITRSARLSDGFSTLEELEAAYAEDPSLCPEVVSCAYIELAGSGDDMLQRASEIAAAYASGTSLEELAEDESGAVYNHIDGIYYTGSALTEWLFSAEHTAGESAVVETANGWAVAVFESRHRDERKTLDVRHILVLAEKGPLAADDPNYTLQQTALLGEAHLRAEEIYEEWKAGAATEESFAELAGKYSDDKTAADGGLFTQVYYGWATQEYNDWCFAPERKSGDVGVTDADFGSHVIYYVRDNLPRWAVDFRENLNENALSNWLEELMDSAGVERETGLDYID